MKVAVAYEKGEICQHFGHTKQFKIYDIKENKIIKEEIIDVDKEEGHGALAKLLSSKLVDMLICGGIGNGAKEALKLANIEIYAGITGSSDNAVSRLLERKLEHNENANCNHNSKEHNCSHKCNENKNGCSGN